MWRRAFAVGTVIEGPVTSLTKFGAFVQLAEGIEGMIHVSDISAEKRIEYPQDVLKVGQLVKAQVLSVDTAKRLLRLGMKQLVPTSLDEYIAEHKEGDVVTGRMGEVSNGQARVELGDGINATCRIVPGGPAKELVEAPAPVFGEAGLVIAEFEAQGALEGRRHGQRSETRSRPRRTDSQVQDYQAGPGRQKN